MNWSQCYIRISSIFSECPFLVSGVHLCWHLMFSHYVFLSSSGLWQFLRLLNKYSMLYAFHYISLESICHHLRFTYLVFLPFPRHLTTTDCFYFSFTFSRCDIDGFYSMYCFLVDISFGIMHLKFTHVLHCLIDNSFLLLNTISL